ncbi:hypothetical protein FJ251_05015 [bacterium]|nr:hypothetical protein [bacterium]
MSRPFAMLLACLLAACAGCQHYTIEVTLDADGGGRRVTELACDAPGPTPEAALSHFREGFALSEAAGWQRVERADEPQRLVFRRERSLAAPADWSGLSGEIAIPGRPGTAASGVLFANAVEVELTPVDGGRSLSYRERFEWQGILPAAAGILGELGEAALAADYPALDPLARAELRGLLAGAALRYIALEQEDAGEPAYETFLTALAEQARGIVARVAPSAAADAIAERLDGVLRGGGEEGDQRVAERLPGLDLVAATDLELRLTLPGPIGETNADRVEGNTAVWVFGLSDALLEPVQLYARTRVGD